MTKKQKYQVIGSDGTTLPVVGYFHSKNPDIDHINITLGKNPTAVPWLVSKLVRID